MITQAGWSPNAQWLFEHRAWNWKWPDAKGRWFTNKKRKRHASQAYHGPSDRTVARRVTRKGEAGRGHNYRTPIGRV